MTGIKQLKNQARKEEQRENWTRAIELYREALEQSARAGEGLPDLSLYNRIGDLHLRQNDPGRAVEYYLEAVERYAEQELYGGAIALCDKILRVAPDRVEVYRHLGRLHAATGLVAEARANFLEYATRLEKAEDEDGPIDAFLELARLTSDPELHLEVVDRLLERGRRDEAIRELGTLHARHLQSEPLAGAIRRRLESFAPELLENEEPKESTATSESVAPEEALERAERSGDLRAALDATVRLLEEDADRVAIYRKRVELASALDDRPLLVRSYLELARCLERADSGEAALAVYRRIVELEPDHPAARGALRAAVEPEEDEPDRGSETEGLPGPGDHPEPEATRASAAEPGPSPEPSSETEAESERGADRDFDDMLVGFRARSAETVGEADPEAHCELGIALHQMGRLDDAIREFQAATRVSEPPILAFELLGKCFLEQELNSVAVRVLTRALRLPGHAEVELLGVLYRLGVAHQTLGASEKALECFERVYSIDIDFRDVGERMRACAL